MADEKKTDDYRINMPERSDSFNRPASPMVRASQRQAPVTDNAMVAILSYCASSILMTVTNKYVLSGFDFNLNFFLLCVQSVVCVAAIQTCKSLGIIHYRDFNSDEARKCMSMAIAFTRVRN
jgi:GDP-mannose transporter